MRKSDEATAPVLDENVLSVVELKDAIAEILETKSNLFVSGMPGIGKTEIPRQIASDMGIGFIRIVLPQYEEVDLKGVPEIGDNKRTVFYPADVLPQESRDGARGILLFDEFPSAKPSVQVVAHELLDSRRLGSLYSLPAGWVIVLTGNTGDDGAYVHEIPTTVKTRCMMQVLAVGAGEWCKWALDSGRIEPELVSFVKKNEFIVFDPNSPDCNFSIPRTLETASKYLSYCKKTGRTPAANRLVGCIGKAQGMKLHGWWKIASQIPDPDAIMAGTEKTIPATSDLQYCTVVSLLSRLSSAHREKDKEIVGKAKRVISYANELPNDIAMAFATDLIETEVWDKNRSKLSKCQEWLEFAAKHGKGLS